MNKDDLLDNNLDDSYTVKVACSCCKQESKEVAVKFVSIESDIFDRDVLTFVCPHCQQISKSLRYL